ncbi:hypothetical protein ACWYXK_06780 [Janthinobacterium lividum]
MEQEHALKLYNEALDRLVAGKPVNVAKGTRINNDAVSLEASRGKGSIKKSRAGYANLILRIDAAALQQSQPKREATDRAHRKSERVKELEEKLDAALGREMSLVYELLSVRKQLAGLTDEKVVPIRRGQAPIRKTQSNFTE